MQQIVLILFLHIIQNFHILFESAFAKNISARIHMKPFPSIINICAPTVHPAYRRKHDCKMLHYTQILHKVLVIYCLFP